MIVRTALSGYLYISVRAGQRDTKPVLTAAQNIQSNNLSRFTQMLYTSDMLRNLYVCWLSKTGYLGKFLQYSAGWYGTVQVWFDLAIWFHKNNNNSNNNKFKNNNKTINIWLDVTWTVTGYCHCDCCAGGSETKHKVCQDSGVDSSLRKLHERRQPQRTDYCIWIQLHHKGWTDNTALTYS